MASPNLTFHDGHTIPQLGLGVYKIPNDETARVVGTALEIGYRHLDTASLYANEKGVGDGIRASGVTREEIFVTTKVWNDKQGQEKTLRAFDTSLGELGLDYVDLYLIHWPAPAQDLYVDTWKALGRLAEEGRARSIGVSNFHPHHLERLIGETGIVPVINQVELHPWFPQTDLRAFDAKHGVLTEAWAPLARGAMLDTDPLRSIAAKHGKSPAQVVLRWHIQSDIVVIPKSVNEARLRENYSIFDFELDADDMAAIATLDTGSRTSNDPDLVD